MAECPLARLHRKTVDILRGKFAEAARERNCRLGSMIITSWLTMHACLHDGGNASSLEFNTDIQVEELSRYSSDGAGGFIY